MLSSLSAGHIGRGRVEPRVGETAGVALEGRASGDGAPLWSCPEWLSGPRLGARTADGRVRRYAATLPHARNLDGGPSLGSGIAHRSHERR